MMRLKGWNDACMHAQGEEGGLAVRLGGVMQKAEYRRLFYLPLQQDKAFV